MKKAFVNIKYNLVDADGNMHLTIGSLIEINSITTGSNNISSRKVNVKPYRFNKMYMDKDLIYYKLYQIVDQFSERKTTTLKLFQQYIHFLIEMVWWDVKILFANDDKKHLYSCYIDCGDKKTLKA